MPREDFRGISRRLTLSFFVAGIVFSLLGIRLYYLQGIRGSYYRNMSENNRRRTIRMLPPRGDVYDRQGRVLVRNRPSFNLAIMREDVIDLNRTLNHLSRILEVEASTLKEKLSNTSYQRPFVPQVLINDLDREALAKVKANIYRLPGVIIQAIPTRTYPHADLAAHVLGYVREINKAQLAKDTEGFYRQGDYTGQSGLEKQFEKELRGKSGYLQVEVDARGNRRSELFLADAKKGNDIHLTIDLDLQKQAEKSLGEFSGSVVAIEPGSGDVLALASNPRFNANIFSGSMDAKKWSEVSQDKKKPLRNRAISNHYPPGSTVKLLFAAAGLSSGVITGKTVMQCPGYYKFGRRLYHCHKRAGHGRVDVAKAIRSSCNVFFYQLGHKLGIDRIFLFADLFGFGKATGIDLLGEENGILPSKAWKLKRFGERWYPGETLSVAIGQGYFAATPLQQAISLAAIVNGGFLYKPKLLKKVVKAETKEEIVTKPNLIRKVSISKEVLENVTEYAEGVVQHKEGTGKRAGFPKIRVGGKTGTAQVRSLKKASEEEEEKFKDHAWFVGFAPAEDPKIVVAVLVENAGHGGVAAAPVAKEVLKVYLDKLGYDTSEEEEDAKK